MKLYAEYLMEREGTHCLHSGRGFATYKYNEDLLECYIADIYIREEFRQSGEAARMADQIAAEAKEKGMKFLTGTVQVGANGDTTSLRVFLSYGMRLDSIKGSMIILVKDL
jgi:hypothetical protein